MSVHKVSTCPKPKVKSVALCLRKDSKSEALGHSLLDTQTSVQDQAQEGPIDSGVPHWSAFPPDTSECTGDGTTLRLNTKLSSNTPACSPPNTTQKAGALSLFLIFYGTMDVCLVCKTRPCQLQTKHIMFLTGQAI